MTTGHEGSLSTLHASGPDDALRRLETMTLMADVALPLTAVREQVASAVDLLVHMVRHADGERRIESVAEVVPASSGWRVRLLADTSGVTALPSRWRRRDAPAPDRSWL
jgi:pilus assembly protein CpaF